MGAVRKGGKMREFEEEVEESVTVGAPLREVYDQWTQFESFPSFMGE
jgi:uncharacterized membrane protein